MRTLTDVESAAVVAIIKAPAAWSWAERVPDGAFRREIAGLVRPGAGAGRVRGWLEGLGAAGHAGETLDGLHASGWLAPWHWPQRGAVPAWTLTPWAADALGLVIGEEWAYKRVRGEEFRGPQRKPAKVWRREFSEEPRWSEAKTDAHGANLYPPVVLPPGERLGEGLAEWQGEPGGVTPEQEAAVNEAAELLRLFEADPVGNFACLEAAESIVAGFTACVKDRWAFDDNGRPLLLFGQLVPRENRGRRRAG